jgi:hypothetical protein
MSDEFYSEKGVNLPFNKIRHPKNGIQRRYIAFGNSYPHGYKPLFVPEEVNECYGFVSGS